MKAFLDFESNTSLLLQGVVPGTRATLKEKS
jgi:hypothetical protein